jgi:hypothetical protein
LSFVLFAGDVYLQVLLQVINDLKNEVHNVALEQHIMNEKFPEIIQVYGTPFEYNKSKHKEIFFDLLSIFGFGRSNIASKIENFTSVSPPKSAELNLSFRWGKGQQESDSYKPLLQHLCEHGICAVDVSEGVLSLVLRRALDVKEKPFPEIRRGLEKA